MIIIMIYKYMIIVVLIVFWDVTFKCKYKNIQKYNAMSTTLNMPLLQFHEMEVCGKLDFYVDKHSADGVGGQGKGAQGEPGRRPQSVKTQHSSSNLKLWLTRRNMKHLFVFSLGKPSFANCAVFLTLFIGRGGPTHVKKLYCKYIIILKGFLATQN